MKFLIAPLLLLLAIPSLADYPLEIIDLKSRPVEQVLPLVEPFIDRDGSIAGMNNQLIIRTSPNNLREIRRILEQVDRPARRLMIYVRQGGGDLGLSRRSALDINAAPGNDTKVIVGMPSEGSSIRYRTKGGNTRSMHDETQRVQTQEGQQAFIETGEQLPVFNYDAYGAGPYRYRGGQAGYKNATSGFYARPRLNGDRVTVEISPRLLRRGNISGNFDVQQAQTVVSGRLGEWLPVGGASGSGYDAVEGVGYSARTQGRQQRTIYLKVEELR